MNVSSHTARPRALKGVGKAHCVVALRGFIPYGSTESTERSSRVEQLVSDLKFHPIRLDREH